MFKLLISAMCLFILIQGCAKKPERIEIRQQFSQGKIAHLTPQELELEKTLKDAAKLKAAIAFAKGMFDVAYIMATEHKNLGFTVYFKGNEVIVERGLDTSKEPTLVIPLCDEGISNIRRFFEDGVIDDREEFLIVNALFKPGWETSYRISDIQSPWIRKVMKLDGLMHVELVNEKNYEFKGTVVKNELSVVRVSNQWLIFKGLEGMPDCKMKLTPKDAIAMYKLVVRELPQASAFKEKVKIMNKFKEIRSHCMVKG